MFWKAASVGLEPDLTLLNVVACRTDREAGDLTLGEVYSLLPFSKELVLLDLIGEEVVEVLEHRVTRALFEEEGGTFPYIHGLRYTAKVSQEAGPHLTTMEVGSAESNWTVLEANATYRVVTIAYLASRRGRLRDVGQRHGLSQCHRLYRQRGLYRLRSVPAGSPRQAGGILSDSPLLS